MSFTYCATLFVASMPLSIRCDGVNVIAGIAKEVPSFDEYIILHGRTYRPGDSEYKKRHQIYKARVYEITAHNRNKNRMWTAGVNVMSDRTKEEMASFNGFRKPGFANGASSFLETSGDQGDLGYVMPTDHSWETVDIDGDKKNETVRALKAIRSQSCGNCWAVALNALMEAHRQIHGGVTSHYDDHELTECSENFFNCGGQGGCQGSTPELALMHYEKNGFSRNPDTGKYDSADSKHRCPKISDIVNKAEKPPHEIRDGLRQTPDNSPMRQFGLTGWEKLPENRGWPIMLALYEWGPVAVAVATGGWHQYSSGVYGGCGKDATIGHSVLAIGFGQVQYEGQTVKYWRLQNSWGSSFGENGHFRLLRHDADEEHCGMDNRPQDGTGCDGGPASVRICGMCGILYDALVPYSLPQTWLSKRLQALRSLRESTGREKASRSERSRRHHVVTVDEGGHVVTSTQHAQEPIQSHLWIWPRSLPFLGTSLLLVVLVGIATGCCKLLSAVVPNQGAKSKPVLPHVHASYGATCENASGFEL